MNKANVANTAPQQDKDYEVAVERFMTDIEHIRGDLAESQTRITRLRAESTGILAETRRILTRLIA